MTHEIGLHARPSLKLTKLAKSFSADISLGTSDKGPWIDAKSINKVMKAKIPRDTVLYFEAAGADAAAAVEALTTLVQRGFQDGESTAAKQPG